MRSVSDIKNNRPLRVWAGITGFCILFSLVYEHFSFGVWSMYMALLGLIPLLLGVIPALFHQKSMGRLWNDGVLCLIAGSMAQGIFEIYGTSSPWPHRLMIIGTVLLIAQLFLRWLSVSGILTGEKNSAGMRLS